MNLLMCRSVDPALFSNVASASTKEILTIAQHTPDVTSYEAPKAATSSSQNNINSNSITILAVVCGIALTMAIVIAITVALRSKCAIVCFFIIVNIIYFIDPKSRMFVQLNGI